MISGIELLIICLIILAIGFIILSIFASSFAESLVIKVTDWCIQKMEVYETKGVKRFSVRGVIWFVCSFVLTIFRYIDRIENEKLKSALKLNAASFIFSGSIAIVSFLAVAFFYLVALYIAFKIFVYILWLIAGRPSGDGYGSDLSDIVSTLKMLLNKIKKSEETTSHKFGRFK